MARFFIDRPIFAWVIALFLLVAGGVSIRLLPIAQYPTVAPPSLSVTAFYPGASAKTLEESVLSVIEQEMNGVDDSIYFYSVNTNAGNMTLYVNFEVGTDPNIDQVLSQMRFTQAESKLPEDVRN
jgi:multidrug efflux pump subunit AcrB